MIDSQSVKTTELADSRGFDGNKRIKGHKRHVAVDISGIPLMVKVTDANASDSKSAYDLLESMFNGIEDSTSIMKEKQKTLKT